MRGVDSAFGNWLAGFIDGEGCFYIAETTPRYYRCGFGLELRLDDADVLYHIQRTLGIGRLYHRPERGRNDAPQIKWGVQSKRECMVLARILEEHPLRAKKARDFAIWRVALKERRPDWERMLAYKTAISEARRFDGSEQTDVPADPPQLRLVV